MPKGNGTGPDGAGPMTGRKVGCCAGFGAPGFAYTQAGFGRCGRGRGFGAGFRGGRGLGLGRGCRPNPSKESEARPFRAEAYHLRSGRF